MSEAHVESRSIYVELILSSWCLEDGLEDNTDSSSIKHKVDANCNSSNTTNLGLINPCDEGAHVTRCDETHSCPVLSVAIIPHQFRRSEYLSGEQISTSSKQELSKSKLARESESDSKLII